MTESDTKWAIEHQGFIFDNQPNQLPRSKEMATLMLLQSISRMDYNCLNRLVSWKDKEEKIHTAVYHPMDLLHQIVDQLGISSRCKLYQKLSLCKLAVPVLLINKDLTYMRTSLHHVKTSWAVGGKRQEGSVTTAPIHVVSMMRIGKMSENFFSKSKLANDILGFRTDAKIGSCGFFNKSSAASNNRRKLAEGNVEGMWYEKSYRSNAFESSFTLLNLRGNAQNHIQTSLKLASATDTLILFCDEDMFKDNNYFEYLDKLGQETKVVKKVIIVFTKACMEKIRQCHLKFAAISSNYHYQLFDGVYQKCLTNIQDEIDKSLKNEMISKVRSLDERFVKDENLTIESTGIIIEKTLDVSDSFIKQMDALKRASENPKKRSEIRMNIFPLQSFTKEYAHTVRQEYRCLDIHMKRKLEGEAYANLKSQYEKISKGLPEIMSNFLEILFEYEGSEQQMSFVRGVQESLDNWCSDHLFKIRRDFSDAFEKLIAFTDDERNKRKETGSVDTALKEKIKKQTEECENLNLLLLDLSVGIESIFREIGQICESTIRNESSLSVAQLKKCAKKLPKLAASLLLEGVALEIMDGDGLSCPTKWIESVLLAVEEIFKLRTGIKGRDPKVFVLTILGTQSTGKSTLLNTMFGVHFPVSAGRCTKGAFLQLIPLQVEECVYDALIVIDTEGLGAPEYKDDKTHDNEIATFVLGIADLVLINVRGELPLNIESFLEVSTAALMRMTDAECHPSAMFVHQNCDPSAKDKNDAAKEKFMKTMNAVVQSQASYFQMKDKFLGFQDVVDISISNDFLYFPQLFEGAPPMAPPSYEYSMACWKLTSSILQKMKSIYQKNCEAQTFRSFSEKVINVWNGVLKEAFVFSLVNNAEIVAKYAIGEKLSKLKFTMVSQIDKHVNVLTNIIEASFKSTTVSDDATEDCQKSKERSTYKSTFDKALVDFDQFTNTIFQKQKDLFLNFIAEQATNKSMYKKWEQRCINELEENKNKRKKEGDTILNSFYTHKLNKINLTKTIDNSRVELENVARETATNLISAKEKEAGTEDIGFTDNEINSEFNKFWKTVQERFKTQKKSAFQSVDVVVSFRQAILSQYRRTTNFSNIAAKFGDKLENDFQNDWIIPKYLEFKSKGLREKFMEYFNINDQKWLSQKFRIISFVDYVITRVKKELLEIITINDLTKMKFQDDSVTFNCNALVEKYLVRAQSILETEHEKTAAKKEYELTDQFKIIFCYYAAQKAKPFFTRVQRDFLHKTDVSIDDEKKNVKQLFTLLLRKEKELTIAATMIAAMFHKIVTRNKPLMVKTEVFYLILGLLTQKTHVHGLVLYDVIDMVTYSIDHEESKKYLNLYFHHPFEAFENKIKEVIEGNKNLKIDDRLAEKITASFRELEKWLSKVEPSEEKPLVDVICENPIAKNYGIGKSDFCTIKVPEMPKKVDYAELTEEKKNEEEEKYRQLNEKRKLDEKEIIARLINLIPKYKSENIKASEMDRKTIINTLITDVNNHLFACKTQCPFCLAPCNETHEENATHREHCCNCHRPQGFGIYKDIETNIFVTESCNELVNTNVSFQNCDTDWKFHKYRDYKSVNSDYNSWEITDASNNHLEYWKYITCKVMDKLDQFYPAIEKADTSDWKDITKDECLNVIKKNFHLDEIVLTKDINSGHYILT